MINGKTLRNASNILVSNNNTLDVIIKEYNVAKEKISIVPNGVDLSKFNISKQKNPKKIVFAGAMYYHRGLDLLLNAIPKIVKIIPDSIILFNIILYSFSSSVELRTKVGKGVSEI